MVDKVALWQVFLQVLLFFPISIFPASAVYSLVHLLLILYRISNWQRHWIKIPSVSWLICSRHNTVHSNPNAAPCSCINSTYKLTVGTDLIIKVLTARQMHWAFGCGGLGKCVLWQESTTKYGRDVILDLLLLAGEVERTSDKAHGTQLLNAIPLRYFMAHSCLAPSHYAISWRTAA